MVRTRLSPLNVLPPVIVSLSGEIEASLEDPIRELLKMALPMMETSNWLIMEYTGAVPDTPAGRLTWVPSKLVSAFRVMVLP